MRACRTARRGIFRFKTYFCGVMEIFDGLWHKCTPSPSSCRRIIFMKRALHAKSLQTKLRRRIRSEFAMRCEFDPAVRRFLLHSTEFAPLQNDKIYGEFSLAAGLAVRCVCFAGKVLRRAINLKCERSQIAGVRLNLKQAIGQISDAATRF